MTWRKSLIALLCLVCVLIVVVLFTGRTRRGSDASQGIQNLIGALGAVGEHQNPSWKLVLELKDDQGNPVENATVDLKVYEGTMMGPRPKAEYRREVKGGELREKLTGPSVEIRILAEGYENLEIDADPTMGGRSRVVTKEVMLMRTAMNPIEEVVEIETYEKWKGCFSLVLTSLETDQLEVFPEHPPANVPLLRIEWTGPSEPVGEGHGRPFRVFIEGDAGAGLYVGPFAKLGCIDQALSTAPTAGYVPSLDISLADSALISSLQGRDERTGELVKEKELQFIARTGEGRHYLFALSYMHGFNVEEGAPDCMSAQLRIYIPKDSKSRNLKVLPCQD